MKKRSFGLAILLALLILLTACGSKEPSKDYITIHKTDINTDHYQIENEKTGESVSFPCDVFVFDLLIDNVHSKDVNGYTYYFNGGYDKLNYSLLAWGDANFLTSISTFAGATEDWVVDGVLKVGMDYSELVSAWGEADSQLEDGEYKNYNYYRLLESGDQYCVTCRVKQGKTIVHWEIHENNIYNSDLAQYSADGVLAIRTYGTSFPNSAGGVDMRFAYKNLSPDTIKYINVTATPYNSVNDPVFMDAEQDGTQTLTITGPISSGLGGEKIWNNVWHDETIAYAKIDEIEIIYMDEAKEPLYLKMEE